MTRIRQSILDLIENSKKPMSAAQVYKESSESADLATIYRGLQYLEDKQYLESFVFACDCRGGIERYYTLRAAAHKHYFHCSHCHRFFPLKNCPIDSSIEKMEKDNAFKISRHFLTLTGTCRDCQE
ncbi:MAG: transcriptional repressor [Spirochaetales bacterium]|nr:transcriptional repressor [Spirochaetales bacterium]